MPEEFKIVKQNTADATVLSLEGVLDESAILESLFLDTRPHIRLNLRKVKRINSCGVREWINALKSLPADRTLEFWECSPAMVKQFNIIVNFAGPGKVRSIMAPYFCSACVKREEQVLEIEAHREALAQKRAPAFNCPTCGGAMEFDDFEERYFQFVEYQKP